MAIHTMGSSFKEEGFTLVATEDIPEGELPVEEEPVKIKTKIPETQQYGIDFTKEDKPPVKPKIEETKPLPLPPVQDIKIIIEHPVPPRLFTINPVDISEQTVSTAQEYLARKIVPTDKVKEGNLVIVCASCGKISPSELCFKCYPNGFCKNCKSPLNKSGNCPHCAPFGICPVCNQVRQVEGICGTDYCRDQGPVIRCYQCHKPLGLDLQCQNGNCPRSKVHSFSCDSASCKRYCKKRVKGEDEETAEARDTRDIACKLWGVDQSLNIANEAMNFYVTWGVARLHEDKKAIKLLEAQVDRLSKQLAAYFDLALGGELRHCMVYNGQYKDRIPKWLQKEYPCRQARPCAWLRWKDVRDEFGLDALRDAMFCFKLPGWPSSYGGNNWATIAFTLLEYLEGRVSAIVFLDSAFSLEHNCGCAFNKIYNTNYVREALDVCFTKTDPSDIIKSNMKNHIDPEIIALVQKYDKKE